jgi:PAS domain S-box-containing protein
MPEENINPPRESEESSKGATKAPSWHLAAIVKSSEDAIISKDLEGKILSWNKGAEKIFGYAAEEAIGKPVTILIPPYRLDEEPLIIERIKRGEQIDHYETIRRRKDGTEINISLTVSPIQDETGRVVGASKIARDITERVRTEEILREHQMRLALAMQSSRMGAWEQEKSTDIVLWSEELEEIFGLEKGSFGQTRADFYQLIHEEDREKVWSEVEKAIEEHRDYTIEFRFHHSDGSVRWMEGRGEAVYSDKGEPVRLYGIGLDITDRKQTQERLVAVERQAAEDYQALLSRMLPLAQTFGTARNLITIYRTVGEFIRTSMPCSAFFISFYDPAKNLRTAAYAWGSDGEVDISTLPPMKLTKDGGPNSQAIFHKEAVIINHYWDFMKKRPHVVLQEDGIDPNSSMVVPMKVKNRVLGTFEVQAYEENAFTQEHLVSLEMVANLAAVAIENVRLLDDEAKARLQAEVANRAKDEFLSVLSHELRTPLNAMLGWTRMMQSGLLDEKRMVQAIETIERNARLQNNLIEDLLDVSRIISGKMLIANEEVDIVSIVKNCVEAAKPSAQDKNVSLIFESDLPAQTLNGDATRLQQIVNNLLNNAIKFTQAGNVFVTMEHNENIVRIKVKDTGVGISSDFLPQIFDRFKQADSTPKRSHSGLGLGMTIVRHLTELHGGTVEVFSDGEGSGATFTIELPVVSAGKDAVLFVDPLDLPRNDFRLKGAKILLVDDDCEGMQPLQILLETQQANVSCAESAREALEKIAEERFDILVSDIGMPEMDGLELINEVQKLTDQQNYRLPAIALTAYAASEDRERVLSAGYQTHLAKPVDFDQFLSTVDNLLDQEKKSKLIKTNLP